MIYDMHKRQNAGTTIENRKLGKSHIRSELGVDWYLKYPSIRYVTSYRIKSGERAQEGVGGRARMSLKEGEAYCISPIPRIHFAQLPAPPSTFRQTGPKTHENGTLLNVKSRPPSSCIPITQREWIFLPPRCMSTSGSVRGW